MSETTPPLSPPADAPARASNATASGSTPAASGPESVATQIPSLVLHLSESFDTNPNLVELLRTAGRRATHAVGHARHWKHTDEIGCRAAVELVGFPVPRQRVVEREHRIRCSVGHDHLAAVRPKPL
jgi:hypothetical protein